MNRYEAISADDGRTALLPSALEKDTEFLRNLLQIAKSKLLDDWLGVQLETKLSSCDNTHTEALKKYKEQEATLNQKLTEIRDKKSQLNQEKEQMGIQAARLDEELVSCQAELDSVLRTSEDMQEALLSVQAEHKMLKEALDKESQTMTDTQNEIQNAVSFFREGAAVQVKKVPGDRMQVVFTCIDRKEPSRPFTFCVRITQDRSYEVSDCHPMVPDLDSLLSKLNKTNNFQAFVITMRSRFKQLV